MKKYIFTKTLHHFCTNHNQMNNTKHPTYKNTITPNPNNQSTPKINTKNTYTHTQTHHNRNQRPHNAERNLPRRLGAPVHCRPFWLPQLQLTQSHYTKQRLALNAFALPSPTYNIHRHTCPEGAKARNL